MPAVRYPTLHRPSRTALRRALGDGTRLRDARKRASRHRELLTALAVLTVLAVVTEMLDGNDVFVFRGIEHDDALGGTACDSNALDRTTNQLSLVGHQHDLVTVFDRERRHQLAVAIVDRHRNDTFAASARGPVLERRRALAVAVFADCQNELFAGGHFDITLLAELDGAGRFLVVGPGLFLGATATYRIGAAQIGRTFFGVRIHVAQDGQRDQFVPVGQGDTAHAHRSAPLEHPHVGDGEADALAAGGGQKHVVMLGADLHVDDRLGGVEFHGDNAGAPDVDEVRKLVAADIAAGGGEHHIEIGPGRFVLGQRHDRGDALALLERQDVDQRFAARIRRRHRQSPDLFLVDLAARGEKQYGRVGRGHEQPADEILVAGLHARAALAAPALGAIGRQRYALDITGVRYRDNHVLALDQVLVLDLVFLVDDDGLARGREFRFYLGQFRLDDRLHPGARAQYLEIVGDLDRQLVEFFGNFVAPERRQALQPQVEDGFRLF